MNFSYFYVLSYYYKALIKTIDVVTSSETRWNIRQGAIYRKIDNYILKCDQDAK